MARFINARRACDSDCQRVIDRDEFPHWGPARNPTKAAPGDSRAILHPESLDETLYQLPNGSYALVWNTIALPSGYEYYFEMLDDAEAAMWCVNQGIDPPEGLHRHLNLLGWTESVDGNRPAKPAPKFILVSHNLS